MPDSDLVAADLDRRRLVGVRAESRVIGGAEIERGPDGETALVDGAADGSAE